MPETVLLVGSEQVERASYAMAAAAEKMERAASSFDSVFETQRRFLDEWLARFEAALERTGK